MLYQICLLVFEKVYDSAACLAVAVRVDSLRHLIISSLVVKQLAHLVHNLVIVGAHKMHCSQSQRLRTFCRVAHHEHRLAQTGSFFLDAARVGEHNR